MQGARTSGTKVPIFFRVQPKCAREEDHALSNLNITPVMRELPDVERPREKLLRYGARNLENRDLLALLLGTGAQSVSALGLADRLLVRFGSLSGVLSASVEELKSLRGVGTAKAALIVAAGEAGRRNQVSPVDRDTPIRSAGDVAQRMADRLRRLDREEVWVLLLDTKHRVVGTHVVSIGHLSGAPVHPRELFKEAIRRSAAAVVVVHNHPSGDPTPSADDLALTRRLRKVGDVVGIEVLDHVIIGDERHVSLRESGAW